MPHHNIEREKMFLQIGFRSSETGGRLQTIEMFGLPGERLKDGTYTVNEKTQRFFDDLIVRKIFRESRRVSDCDFEYLKIWLYDTEISDNERGFAIPKLDHHDLEIQSNEQHSRLERIYILDNGLQGAEYERWKRICKDLFTPLFRGFIAPPEPPSRLGRNPLGGYVVKFLDALTETVDEYAKKKQNLFFNALIIQID